MDDENGAYFVFYGTIIYLVPVCNARALGLQRGLVDMQFQHRLYRSAQKNQPGLRTVSTVNSIYFFLHGFCCSLTLSS